MGVAQHRARLALVCAVAMLGAACAAPADEPDDDTSNAASTTSTGAESRRSRRPRPPTPCTRSTRRAARRARVRRRHAAREQRDDPGRRSSSRSWTSRSRGRPAVTAAEPLSHRAVLAGEQELPDRRRRRRRVPQVHARAGEQAPRTWDRFAAGEIAVRDDLQDRLPLDKDGYLAVGSGERTFPIHVGAYAPQIGTVDAVVNDGVGRGARADRGQRARPLHRWHLAASAAQEAESRSSATSR